MGVMRFTFLIGVTRHHPQMPTVETIAAPLRQVAANLQYIAISLRFQLLAAISKAHMTTYVTHPHAGHFLLAR